MDEMGRRAAALTGSRKRPVRIASSKADELSVMESNSIARVSMVSSWEPEKDDPASVGGSKMDT